MEGRRHDMTLFRRSKVGELLSNSLMIADEQFYIYGDLVYLLRPYL